MQNATGSNIDQAFVKTDQYFNEHKKRKSESIKNISILNHDSDPFTLIAINPLILDITINILMAEKLMCYYIPVTERNISYNFPPIKGS